MQGTLLLGRAVLHALGVGGGIGPPTWNLLPPQPGQDRDDSACPRDAPAGPGAGALVMST